MVDSQSIPRLSSAHNSIKTLERHFLAQQQIIEDWFKKEWEKTTPPFYGSVDLRNAGFKLAPIDMNLFPAGFNNLNPNFMATAAMAAKKIVNQLVPHAKKILIIPESHTRNLFYWSNIKTLQTILEKAGFEVRFGRLNNENSSEPAKNADVPASADVPAKAGISSIKIDLPTGEKVDLFPLQRSQDKLKVQDFIPDMVILNNDLSEGIPEILTHLKQSLFPPASLGWSQRLKSGHFQYYAKVAQEFAQLTKIDPWLIDPLFSHCGEINFMQQEGLDCLIHHASNLFTAIEKKYKEYDIKQQPFLIVKADAGTYGMAVMTVRNVDELKNLNRKQRTRMATTKGGQTVNRVIIQEGVYTFETLGDAQAVAEPVIYLMGCTVIGGFYRVHKERGIDENLNAPGMHFEPLPFSQPCHEPRTDMATDACQNRYYTYGIVAQLSMLAAAREIKDQI